MENRTIYLAVLPDLGAKIASLRYKPKDLELAAQCGEFYGDPPQGADFSQYDASGIDDVFPSVTPSRQTVNGHPVDYPDHGEIWTGHFSNITDKTNKTGETGDADKTDKTGDSLNLSFAGTLLPYHYHKRISLRDSRIILEYRITNTGDYEFPCIWLFHGLFRYEEDMRLLYPPDTRTLVNVYGGGTLGEPGRRYNINGGEYNFSAAPKRNTKSAEKYYIDGPVCSGNCGYYYPQSGVQVLLGFDKKVIPYLGFWVTAGGFRGDYNCAFEPTNGFYDDIETARQNHALPRLGPGQTMSFSIVIEIGLIP